MNDDVPAIAAPCDDPDDLLTLNDVLDRLAALAPEKAQVVKLLHFVGLNLDETAAVMGISRSAVYRHWVFARAWLRDAMSDRAVSRDLPAQEPLPDV